MRTPDDEQIIARLAMLGADDTGPGQELAGFRRRLRRLHEDPAEAARIEALAAEAEQDQDEDAAATISVPAPSGEAAGAVPAPDRPKPAGGPAIEAAREAPGLFTISDTARIMDLPEKTIRKLIRSGELDTVRKGRSQHVPYRAIQAYQAAHPGPRKKSGKAKKLLYGAAAVAAAGGIAFLATRSRWLSEPDEIAAVVGAPVLASLPARFPASPEEWKALLASYGDNKPAQDGPLHNVLRQLDVTDRGSIVVLCLAADPGALALGPQLAAFTASRGINTALVIGPGADTEATAALRSACATPADESGRLRTVSCRRMEDVKREDAADELTILVTVVHADAGPVLQAIQATTLIVIGVSAGAATEEQLIRLADVGDGRAVAGILFAKPETAGRGTGPGPGPRQDVWSPAAQPKMSASVGAFFESRSVFARLVQVAGEPGPLAARVALRALGDHARRPPLLGDIKRGSCRSSPLAQNSPLADSR
jgi:hypothetical protein